MGVQADGCVQTHAQPCDAARDRAGPAALHHHVSPSVLRPCGSATPVPVSTHRRRHNTTPLTHRHFGPGTPLATSSPSSSNLDPHPPVPSAGVGYLRQQQLQQQLRNQQQALRSFGDYVRRNLRLVLTLVADPHADSAPGPPIANGPHTTHRLSSAELERAAFLLHCGGGGGGGGAGHESAGESGAGGGREGSD